MSTLTITVTNNSNVDASAVYIGFVPGSSGAADLASFGVMRFVAGLREDLYPARRRPAL